MSIKSDIRFSIDTRIKLLHVIEDPEQRRKLCKEVIGLLEAFETRSEDDEFVSLFISEYMPNIPQKGILRSRLYEAYCDWCYDHKHQAESRFYFSKQLCLIEEIRICSVHGMPTVKKGA